MDQFPASPTLFVESNGFQNILMSSVRSHGIELLTTKGEAAPGAPKARIMESTEGRQLGLHARISGLHQGEPNMAIGVGVDSPAWERIASGVKTILDEHRKWGKRRKRHSLSHDDGGSLVPMMRAKRRLAGTRCTWKGAKFGSAIEVVCARLSAPPSPPRSPFGGCRVPDRQLQCAQNSISAPAGDLNSNT
jgi:hypothetical protein